MEKIKVGTPEELKTRQLTEVYKNAILIELSKVKDSERKALNATELLKRTGIKSWVTVKNALQQLSLEGKVGSFKSGPITFYYLKEERSNENVKYQEEGNIKSEEVVE